MFGLIVFVYCLVVRCVNSGVWLWQFAFALMFVWLLQGWFAIDWELVCQYWLFVCRVTVVEFFGFGWVLSLGFAWGLGVVFLLV